MVDYVELLIGEVLLGDVTNTYLYVGEDLEAQQIALGAFTRRVQEEGQQLTSVLTSVGKVVVNGTQRFMFVYKDKFECVTKGTSFNRIFVDVSDHTQCDHIKQFLLPSIVYHDGDFV